MPVMAVVMIGIDPHKASHTAVTINAVEQSLGQLRVRASAVQAERLLGWAQAWPERTWAVEGAGGVREARRDDHAAVLKVWSKRHRDLGQARTQVACRLHQVLCELIPGGVSEQITAGKAGQILTAITPAGAVEAAHLELAAELTEDLRGLAPGS